MRKILEPQKNCGVKLRTKWESDRVISERLRELQKIGRTETKEYEFLLALNEKKLNEESL